MRTTKGEACPFSMCKQTPPIRSYRLIELKKHTLLDIDSVLVFTILAWQRQFWAVPNCEVGAMARAVLEAPLEITKDERFNMCRQTPRIKVKGWPRRIRRLTLSKHTLVIQSRMLEARWRLHMLEARGKGGLAIQHVHMCRQLLNPRRKATGWSCRILKFESHTRQKEI